MKFLMSLIFLQLSWSAAAFAEEARSPMKTAALRCTISPWALKLDNLTNKEYWVGWYTIIPQMPRRLSVSLAYRF